jgi:hypothetical protein
MGEINLSNSKNRDAVLATHSVRIPMKVRWVDEEGRQASTARILKASHDRDAAALEKTAGGMDKIAQALIAGDPEIDIERYGKFLKDTSRVYVDPDGKIVRKVILQEVIRNPDGTERERRPKKITAPNTATETPLKWSGKLMKKGEVYNKFVFVSKIQVQHVNGLTYDFLFNIAKELEEKDSLMLVGAGPKSNQPLIFQRGGTPYRGFLEGRTQGEKYMLILHLSNMELKKPEQVKTDNEANA